MLNRWICLLIALVLCCAPLSAALAEELEIECDIDSDIEVEEIPGDADGGMDVMPDEVVEILPEEIAGMDATAEAEPLGEEGVSGEATLAKGEAALRLSASKLTIGVGEQCAILTATLGEANKDAVVTWSSSKRSVATVDGNTGVITGVKAGTATITATAGDLKSTCKVTVAKAPDKVTVDSKSLMLSPGQSQVLKATLPSGTGSTLTFTSSNKKVVGVDAHSGLITAVAPGSATVTVKTFNNKKAKCKVTVAAGPAEVSLAVSSVTVGVKQSFALSPVFLASDGQVMEGVQFTAGTSNAKAATVSAKGVVKGVKKGTATVTVTAFNGVKATCKVKVVNAPGKVTLSLSKTSICVGETTQAKPVFPSGTMASCTYSSSDKTVAVVDKDGNVTGVGEGSAVIKVRTHNSKTAKVTVKVTCNPNILTLNGNYERVTEDASGMLTGWFSKSLKPGATFQIKCTGEYGVQGATYTYQSDDTDVATVSEKGKVTAVEPGTANIAVISSTGAVSFLRVTVSGTLAGKIAFTVSEASVRVGRTAAAPRLRGTNISAGDLANAVYQSGDESVFTVAWNEDEARWMLTGVNVGSATLTATAGSATASIAVTVSEATGSGTLRFEDARVYMSVGESFAPRVFDDTDGVVSATLASSDGAIAAISDGGVVTALAEGEAKITATVGRLSASMSVVVQNRGAVVALDTGSLDLCAGDRYALKVTVNGNGAATKIDYRSSDAKVATVTSAGVIIARAAGKATVTATEAGGASASCAVTVTAAPTALVVTPSSVSQRLNTGGVQLSWEFGGSGETGSVSFTSSNNKIATVDDSGYVTFVAAGTARISAVTNNGLVTVVPVTVLPNPEKANRTAYRLFAAYSYHDELPFTRRNATTVSNVFGKSGIGGQKYTVKVMGNPAKASLLSGITDFFKDTDDNDVSIVYLCSHGHNTKSSYKNYYMSLLGYDSKNPSANYYMTSQEIFSRVRGIRGSVVLILDSCYSGTFIEDMKSSLDAEGGRIAVLTAASNTRATFYNVKSNSVDFFTFFLLQGLVIIEKTRQTRVICGLQRLQKYVKKIKI